MEAALDKISSYVWGLPLIILLFGTHLFLTFRLGFIQRHLLRAIRISFSSKKEGDGEISHFASLMTALAATIGTGNIVGVAAAVAAGGPGAVLWMWLTGVFGMATKYAEALLSVKYRVADAQGRISGGPMYVLERGLGCKWLGTAFAAFTAVAAFGIGNMVQSNSIAGLAKETFNINPALSGAVLCALTALVILGGIKSIAAICEKLVPVMAIGYVAGCLYILAANFGALPGTIALIFKSAFCGQAALGGFLGAGVKEAMRYGIARGLFSNESGLGSAPIVAAAAQTRSPVRQALVSSTGTFWDTVVICLLTGLVVVGSGQWQAGLKGAALTRAAFGSIPHVGAFILNFGLFTFVYSTILGWEYYGEKAVEYLFGPKAAFPYRLAWVAAVMAGAVVSMPAVWAFADIANGCMALPNIISLLALAPVAAAETKSYFAAPDSASD
ncbi:MAG: sodium:alanine symporter family protein [Elusimicrobiales bacterium]